MTTRDADRTSTSGTVDFTNAITPAGASTGGVEVPTDRGVALPAVRDGATPAPQRLTDLLARVRGHWEFVASST